MKKVIFKNSTNVKFQQLKNVIAKDKLRPELTGVFLSVQESKIVVTNGHAIFVYDVEITDNLIWEGDEKEFNVVIDPKIFNQQTWLSVPKEDLFLVEFHVTESKTEIWLGEEMVAVANNVAHEQPFPKNWLTVMDNSEFKTEIHVDAKLMKQALSAIPESFTSPKIQFGKKIVFESNQEEDEGVKIKGVLMPIQFSESKIYVVSEFINVDETIIGRTTSKRVLKTWNEDFVDEDNGDVVSVERNEIIVDYETVINEDVLQVLKDNGIEAVNVIKQ